MATLHKFDAGGYAFLEGGLPYSAGVIAQDGFSIVRVRFARVLPVNEGFAAIEAHWELVFRDAFQSELKILAAMRQDGLLDLDGQGIQVRPAGRLLIRNICMVFDRYLPEPGQPVRFSKVI